MSCRMPATDTLNRILSTRLKPAVGSMFRQAPPKLRGLQEFPSCSEFQTHSPSEVRGRQRGKALLTDCSAHSTLTAAARGR